MKRGIKKVSLLMCCCVVLSMLCVFSVKAASNSVPYDTTSRQELTVVANDTPNSITLSLNTRPTAGAGGVRVIITKSNGTVVASTTFPYQVSVPDYPVDVPSGEIRRIYIEPITSGQRIAGILSY